MITITTAIIAAISAVSTSVISAKAASDKVQKTLEIQNAVQNTKIDELTREVREHNNFAQRMPVLEQKFTDYERRINTLERTVEKLEKKDK